MMTAVIIDDEYNGRIALRRKLVQYCPDVQIVGEAENGVAGLNLISETQPQLVFLDIEMPVMGGFEMLTQLPVKKFHLVFTTAFDHYAIRAIRFAAFDYLLKPIDIDELRSTIARLSETAVPEQTQRKLETLEQNLLSKPFLNKIAIPTHEGLLFFNLETISHLEAQSNYTLIYFADQAKLIASRTLKDFEEILPSDIFFRPHNSYIINLHFIKRYIRGDGGQIELKDGTYIMVSRRKKEDFLKLIASS
jgi:two-component system LytT family response regulator